ncbi:CDP-alcohol phosphatidyltransferase family protein [Saccharospirillum impatiens]|uniref:CDP-alcohol phosphatidyltransferase family protein n=1 Tax=Saccharospirillum impatiens TaxID=169438 RepID=UPI0003F9F10C|nr:CDP-alcohol phosphatidyltransferase family protein [Saccharospirillum impatiens]
MPASCEFVASIKGMGQLRRELTWIAVLGACVLLGFAVALFILERPVRALGWLLASMVCWGFVLWQCHRRLHLNRRSATGQAYPTLGAGNRITLLRGLLIAATAGFLTFSSAGIHPWLFYVPAALYTLAALGDGLDGYIARRQNQTTELGAELDTVLDAFGLVVAPLLAVLYGKLHVSYLLVSMAYYAFQWGIHWRRRHGRRVFPLPPSQWRRTLAGLQMVLVAIALWPPVPFGVSSLAGVVLMMPLLIGFIRDWLYVSGRLSADPEQAL